MNVYVESNLGICTIYRSIDCTKQKSAQSGGRAAQSADCMLNDTAQIASS